MRTNVVRLRHGTTTYEIAEDVMNQVRMRLYEYDAAELGLAIGRTPGCIQRIRGGYTKWPHASTLFPLLRILGLELRLFDVRGQRYV